MFSLTQFAPNTPVNGAPEPGSGSRPLGTQPVAFLIDSERAQPPTAAHSSPITTQPSLPNRDGQKLKFGVTHCKQRKATGHNRGSQRGKTATRMLGIWVYGFHETRITSYESRILTDSLRIRNGANSIAFTKRFVSNRQRIGDFSEAALKQE